MTEVPCVSVIILNANGLNSSIKRKIGRIDENTDPTICYLLETHLRSKDLKSWKGKDGKTFYVNTKQDSMNGYINIKKQTLNQNRLQETKKDSIGLPGGTVDKNLPAMQGDPGLIPGPGRFHMPQSK